MSCSKASRLSVEDPWRHADGATAGAIDRQSIEGMLRQVAMGNLSVAEAASRLLGMASTDPSRSDDPSEQADGLVRLESQGLESRREMQIEPLASLIARLGPPPDDVVAAWESSLHRRAANDGSRPLALIELDPVAWGVTPSGELQPLSIPPQGSSSTDRERQQGTFEGVTVDVSRTPLPARVRPKVRAACASRRRVRPKWLLLIVLVFAGVGYSIDRATTERVTATESIKTTERVTATESVKTAGSPASIGTIEPPSVERQPVELPWVDRQTASPDRIEWQGMELESVFPRESHSESEPEVTRSSVPPGPAFDADPELDSVDSEVAEAIQATEAIRSGSARFILPTDANLEIILFDNEQSGLSLEFPCDVPLQLTRDPTQASWPLLESAGPVLGTIDHAAGKTVLRWSDQAEHSVVLRQLVHGRLRTESGESLYLRPSISAEPLPLSLELSQFRPTWDLQAPLPPRLGGLDVRFTLPEAVKIEWIEPIVEAAPRRSRGLAVFSMAEEEHVAVAIRLEFRCTNRLIANVRFAARLDPQLPWQLLTPSGVKTTGEELTILSTVLATQTTAMTIAYARADYAEKRLLRPRRDALQRATESNRETLQRFAALRRLLSTLEAVGRLEVSVHVRWPDGEQVVLASAPAPVTDSIIESEAIAPTAP